MDLVRSPERHRAAARHGQRVASDCGLASLVAVLGLAKTPDGPPKASGKNLIPGLEKCRFRGLGHQASGQACGNRHVVAPGCGRIWSHGVGDRILDLWK